MGQREGYRGYVTHQPFGGNIIPATGQNAIMQRYAEKNELLFMLSVQELNFPNCYVTLYDLVEELASLQGVIMTSIFIMPQDMDARDNIFERFLDEKCELHFALENLVVQDVMGKNLVEEIFAIAATIPNCPKSIPSEIMEPSSSFISFTDSN